jgi:spoIIIJ-associated protein
VEWVETTGRTVEEAKDAALDQLGVDEEDAEFEIVEEPRLGLFGRLRAEARVRARVRPTTPRPKEDRRDRRRRRLATDTPATSTVSEGGTSGEPSTVTAAPAEPPRSPARRRAGASGPATAAGSGSGEPAGAGGSSASGRGRRSRRGSADPSSVSQRERAGQDGDRQPATAEDVARNGGVGMDVSLDEQASVARDFLIGLVRELKLEADIDIVLPDEDTVEVNLQGEDLGVLIGSKGTTLFALQDLTRTVVQRKTSASNGRLLVDVGGYRHKRKAALERFARQLAQEVNATGTRKVLEPMTAADRKVVHDAVTDIDGVVTASEGEEPYRRVVILPANA